MNDSFSFETAAASHVGNVREINEDSLLDRPEIGLWAIADGMGGHGCGDLASQSVIAALGGIAPPRSAAEFLREFENRIVVVNEDLLRLASERRIGVIGTTLVALLVFDVHYACVWGGDSRAYLLRNGELTQISHDHSEVQELVDSGLISRRDADTSGRRNVVTRALGAQASADLEVVTGRACSGDRFMLCSDGLIGHVSDDEIAQWLRRGAVREACDALLETTLRRGAADNVSVIVLDCHSRRDEAEGARVQGA